LFVLNLLFDLADPDGHFDDNLGGPLLTRSNVWLKREPPAPDPPADPEDANNWNVVGQAGAGTLLIPAAFGEVIGVRIADKPGNPNVPATATLDLVLAFGAPVRATQRHSSPFTDDDQDGGQIRTTFQFNNLAMTGVANKAWFVPVGKIAKTPNKPNRVHRYEFALGAVIKFTTAAGVPKAFHFGVDPEMDVGM
jgi:hypothetical protein